MKIRNSIDSRRDPHINVIKPDPKCVLGDMMTTVGRVCSSKEKTNIAKRK